MGIMSALQAGHQSSIPAYTSRLLRCEQGQYSELLDCDSSVSGCLYEQVRISVFDYSVIKEKSHCSPPSSFSTHTSTGQRNCLLSSLLKVRVLLGTPLIQECYLRAFIAFN